MTEKYIGDLSYEDFIKDKYPKGEAGVNEMMEDTKRMIRYIFENDSDRGKNVINNIYVISGGDAKNQLKLLSSFIILSNPIVSEYGQERVMSYEEIEASFPTRNLNMCLIEMVLKMSVERIFHVIQMQEPINMTEDF